MKLSKLFRGTVGQSAGELILIIVGVLLALSADQWLAEREDRKLLRQHMLGVISEIDSNLRSISNIRDNDLPPKMAALGTIIRTLGEEEPVIDSPMNFLSLLAGSAETTDPWLSRNRYDALKTSGIYHYISSGDVADSIAGAYEAHKVLFEQASAIKGKYGSYVMQLIPASHQSNLSGLAGYVRSDSVAPTIVDFITAEQAVSEILKQRPQIVALARNEAAVVTGTWYALTRMKDEFDSLKEELLDYLESQDLKPN